MRRSSSILMLIFGLCLGTFGEYCSVSVCWYSSGGVMCYVTV
jgi:hypothetical protein